MSQLLFLHLGEAGINMGKTLWDQFSYEHNFDEEGKIINPLSENLIDYSFSSIFEEISSEKYVPKSIFIDTDLYSLNPLKKRNFFNKNNLISGKGDTGNLFPRGFNLYDELLTEAKEQIRKEFERSDKLQAIITTNSINGGTGSGFFTKLIHSLSEDYNKIPKIGFIIYPSKFDNHGVESINSMLCSSVFLDELSAINLIQNSSLYNINQRIEGDKPSLIDNDRLISYLISNFTASHRFDNIIDCSVNRFLSNTIMYPVMHCFINSFYPFNSLQNQEFPTLKSTTEELINSNNCFARNETEYPFIFSCGIMYRGEVKSHDMCFELNNLKTMKISKQIPSFNNNLINASICKESLKIRNNDGIDFNPPISAAMFLNSSSIKEILRENNEVFDNIFSKKAFLHWYYRENMSADDLLESREYMQSIHKEYDFYENFHFDYDDE